MRFFLNAFGKFLATTPEFLVRGFCYSIAWLIVKIPNSRSYAILMNLHHCFPEKSERERVAIAIESASRTIEMGFFVLAMPFLKKEEFKKRFVFGKSTEEELAVFEKKPTLLLVPHFSMMESVSLFPSLTDMQLPKVGVMYRPFDNDALEYWIKSTREKFGVKLLSRKKDLRLTFDYLKSNNILAILFDQNPLHRGALGLFMGMTSTYTTMPDIFQDRFENLQAGIIYARRTGFWRSEICAKRLEPKNEKEIMFLANQWLEEQLKGEMQCDWLWLHNRWSYQRDPAKEFVVDNPINHLEENLKFLNLSECPRKRKYFLNVPLGLKEVLDVLSCLSTLRKSRYDSSFTMLTKSKYIDLISAFSIADDVKESPESFCLCGALCKAKKLRKEYSNVIVQFNGTFIGNLLLKKMGAPRRLVLGKKKHFKNTLYSVDKINVETCRNFFKKCGAVGEFESLLKPEISIIKKEKDSIEFLCNGKNIKLSFQDFEIFEKYFN